MPPTHQPDTTPAVTLRGAGLNFGPRRLFSGLDLEVQPGEFLAVLGPNGAGKSTLLKVLLGLQELSTGSVEIGGRPVTRGSRTIGSIPQQRGFPPDTALRARDLVALGVDGHRWGPRIFHRREITARVERVGSTVAEILRRQRDQGVLAGHAAHSIVQERLAAR